MSEILPADVVATSDTVPEPMPIEPLPSFVVIEGHIVPGAKAPGRPPREPAEWTEPYLRYYAEWGNQHNAARFAGVDAKTARKHRRSDAAFDKAVREARRAFRASMQEELVKQAKGLSRGSTIAAIARLKASGRKMAERYSEKAVDARIMNITVNNQVSHPDATAIMERLTGQLGAQEIAAMRGEIVDAEVLALPLAGAQRPNDEEPE